MKKAILSLAMFLTLGTTILAGASVPVSATIGPEENGTVYYYEDADDNTIYTDCDFDEEGYYATVQGTKNFLALRTDPSYNDDNIIGILHNGDEVIVLNQYSDDYVWVYSMTLGRCGWVNGNYVG